MSKETVRLKGGSAGRSDIIRSLKNIPDRPEYFRDIYKINKELNRNNIKISFGADGKAVMNAAEPFKPAELRQQLKQNAPVVVFSNVPDNPEVNPVNVNSELNLTTPSNIDLDSLRHMITTIQEGYRVINPDDLRSSVVNLLEHLTLTAFNIFVAYVKKFVRENGDNIQRTIHRIIPFEDFFNDIFKIFIEIAEKNNISDFIENKLQQNADSIEFAIKEFYNQFRPTGSLSEKCKFCGGMFYSDVEM